jgi:hypothetical protein
MGFNEFPELPDRFSASIPPEEDNHVHYRMHCFPEIEQIVTRVREVRTSLLATTTLTRVYVLTNGRPWWLQQLKDALQEDARREYGLGLDKWEHIGTTRDLQLTREQRHNSQAVDMAIAQRAEVFLGNGVRSTSNPFCLFFGGGLNVLIGKV